MALDRSEPREDPSEATPEDILQLNGRIWALMRTMKAMLELAPDQQHKRSVVAIEPGEWDVWLRGPLDEARALIRLSPVEIFDAGPELR